MTERQQKITNDIALAQAELTDLDRLASQPGVAYNTRQELHRMRAAVDARIIVLQDQLTKPD